VVALPGLRRKRLEAALSQLELAQLAGMQRQTISRLEGGGLARAQTLRLLASVLRCEPRDLLQVPSATDRK
jgi:transcriptional regulator with XRE-family HTH domain